MNMYYKYTCITNKSIISAMYYMYNVNDSQVVKLKQVEHTLNEKRILSCIKHPFLVHLDGSFKVCCFHFQFF